MKELLKVDYSTYRSWNYRRREIPNDVYLREIVIFERLLSSEERIGAFYKVARRYHEALAGHGMDTYQRYLKLRKIETVDEFYSHLHDFLSRYHSVTKKERAQERYEEMKKKGPLTLLQQVAILKKINKATRQAIYDISVRLNSTDAILVMREFCDYLDTRSGGVSNFIKQHNIQSTSEFLALIQCVIDNESGVDL